MTREHGVRRRVTSSCLKPTCEGFRGGLGVAGKERSRREERDRVTRRVKTSSSSDELRARGDFLLVFFCVVSAWRTTGEVYDEVVRVYGAGLITSYLYTHLCVELVTSTHICMRCISCC